MDDDLKADKVEKTLVVIQAFQDFTDALTIRRILTAMLAGLLALVLYTGFENRASLFSAVAIGQQNEDWSVEESSSKELVNIVKSSSVIKLILVTQVDLRKNRSTTKFWHLSDPDSSTIKQKADSMLPMAAFDYDQKNTQQLVAVLNNEFVCSKTEDTIFNRNFPELTKRMPYICRVAIPPFYGRFVGMLTFGLYTEPSKDQLDALKIEASRISIQIYLRDVMHHKR